jgi:hypothetical protein
LDCDVIIELFDHASSVELDQVLEDQPAPTISARLHKQSAFGKAAQLDRRETELVRKRADLMPLRTNALARAWPILPKPIIA